MVIQMIIINPLNSRCCR